MSDWTVGGRVWGGAGVGRYVNYETYRIMHTRRAMQYPKVQNIGK